MEFHIARAVREKLDIGGLIFGYAGNVVFADVTASRELARRLNSLRGPEADSANPINAGALFAMGLIDELSHALVARYRKEIDPSVHSEAIRWFASKLEPTKVEQLLLAFVEQFPGVEVYRQELTAQEWLNGTTEGIPNREAALEELMLLWLANSNPAFGPFRDLFDDKDLKSQTIYQGLTSVLPDYLATRPPVAPEVGSLLDALRAPMLASPDSIAGQLEFIRENWSEYLHQDLRKILLAIDVLREEDVAIWLRFHPPGPDRHRHGAPTWGGEGFIGDEFVGFDQDFARSGADRRYPVDYQAPLQEYEALAPITPGCPTWCWSRRAHMSGLSSCPKSTADTSTISTIFLVRNCGSSPTEVSLGYGSSACGKEASPQGQSSGCGGKPMRWHLPIR
jgi:hypothetical protein